MTLNREELYIDNVRHVLCGECQSGRYIMGLIACGRCTQPLQVHDACEICGYSDSKMLMRLWVGPQLLACA